MNKDKQRIVIAEACGWAQISTYGSAKGIYGLSPNGVSRCELPDYLNDLNAMAEAFKSLPEKDRPHFAIHLYHLVCSPEQKHDDHFVDWFICAEIANATAAQRAEAFLKTVCKWEEGD
jgi:hypothetical protein